MEKEKVVYYLRFIAGMAIGAVIATTLGLFSELKHCSHGVCIETYCEEESSEMITVQNGRFDVDEYPACSEYGSEERKPASFLWEQLRFYAVMGFFGIGIPIGIVLSNKDENKRRKAY